MRNIFVFFIVFNSFNTYLLATDLPKEIAAPKAVSDRALQDRLNKIFTATQWYPELTVDVKEGLVFLKGRIDSKDKKQWAYKLIEKTEGVVSIVDQLDTTTTTGVLSPAQEEVNSIYEKIQRSAPYVLSGLAILILFFIIAFGIRHAVRRFLERKDSNPILIEAVSNISALLISLMGIYLALNSTGMSGLAVTVLGGTGFLGIGIGLALKGAVENYSASLMISLREVFKKGEFVEINGFQGFVQSVTTRGTSLMDVEGNQIVIPNANVFNSIIKNYTRNPLMRCDFTLNFDVKVSTEVVRQVIEKVLYKLHPVVLSTPEYFVVVSGISGSILSVRTFFWINCVENSKIKTISLVIERVKDQLLKEDIHFSTDSREILFQNSLNILETEKAPVTKPINSKMGVTVNTKNESKDISEQSMLAEKPEKGINLLEVNNKG